MTSRALQELHKLVKIEGISRKDGTLARERALNDWIDKWIEEISVHQDIIKKNLTSQDQAKIGEYLVDQISDNMMENCVKIEQTPNLIRIEAFVIRR